MTPRAEAELRLLAPDFHRWLKSMRYNGLLKKTECESRLSRSGVEIFNEPVKIFFRIKFSTQKYRYSIIVNPGEYIGGSLRNKNGYGGNDLSDGKYCYETFVRIMMDIVGIEME